MTIIDGKEVLTENPLVVTVKNESNGVLLFSCVGVLLDLCGEADKGICAEELFKSNLCVIKLEGVLDKLGNGDAKTLNADINGDLV